MANPPAVPNTRKMVLYNCNDMLSHRCWDALLKGKIYALDGADAKDSLESTDEAKVTIFISTVKLQHCRMGRLISTLLLCVGIIVLFTQG